MTYKPSDGDENYTPPTDLREATFAMETGVSIIGGWDAANPTNPPDPSTFKSILSGGISVSLRSFHVVTATSVDGTAVLDGFVIERGDCTSLSSGPTCGSQGSPGPGGGGLMCVSASPTLRNCAFKSNKGQFGGGVLLFCQSNPIISLCTFDSNVADHDGLGNGGGMYMFYNCAPNVVSCRFVNNTSIHIGGGVAFQELCTPQFTQCVFAGNQTGNNSGNDWGGGMRVGFDCSATIRFCVFYDNSCIGSNCKGGGFAANRDNPPDDGDILIDSCIFMDNSAASGPEMYRDDDAGVTITISHCNVEGGQAKIYDPNGLLMWDSATNFDEDPDFVSFQNDNFNLNYTSPCLNNGNAAALPDDVADVDEDGVLGGTEGEEIPWDLAQHPRKVNSDSCIDVGAYENQLVPSVAPCTGDITGPAGEPDGEVDDFDLEMVENQWGAGGGIADIEPTTDCGDSDADVDDLLLVINNWGTCGSFAPTGLPEWLQDCIDTCGEDYECLVDCIIKHFEE